MLRYPACLLLAAVLAGAASPDEPEAEAREARLSVTVKAEGGLTAVLTLPRPAFPMLALPLGRALGCVLTGVNAASSEAGWFVRGDCPGSLPRRDGVLSANLDLEALGTPLRTLGYRQLQLDILHPDTAYWETPAGVWERSDLGRSVRDSTPIDLERRPVRPVHVAFGYRPKDVAATLAPLLALLLLPLAVAAWLNGRAAAAPYADPRALWFSYVRSVDWVVLGSSAIWILGQAVYSSQLGVFCNWHGLGRGAQLAVEFAPMFLMDAGCLWISHPTLRRLQTVRWRLRDTLSLLGGSEAAVVIPLCFAMQALLGLLTGDWMLLLCTLWSAGISRYLLTEMVQTLRYRKAKVVVAGELRERLQALANRAGMFLREVYCAPMDRGQGVRPFVVSKDAVWLSDAVMESFTPAEVEAAVAHEWCYPLRRYPSIFFVAFAFLSYMAGVLSVLVGGLVVMIPLTLAGRPPQPISTVLIGLLTMAASVAAAWLLWKLLERRADVRGIGLTGDPKASIAALSKLAPLQQAPWKWRQSASALPLDLSARQRRLANLAGAPVQPMEFATPPMAAIRPPAHAESASFREAGAFSPAFQRGASLAHFPAGALLWFGSIYLARTIPLSGWPLGIRLLAYVAGASALVAISILYSELIHYSTYRVLRARLRRKLQPPDGALCVGLSPGAEPRAHDHFHEWDVGFLSLTGGALTYLGERIAFSLGPRQVASIRLDRGSSGWFSPDWIFIDWREGERSGVFALLLPRLRLFSSLQREAVALSLRLQEWRATGAFAPAASAWGLPEFPAIASKPLPAHGLSYHLVRALPLVATYALFAPVLGFRTGSEPFWAVCLIGPVAMLVRVFPSIRWGRTEATRTSRQSAR